MHLIPYVLRAVASSGVTLCVSGIAYAQAGPPFLTNDPGTPGNGHWEINLAVAPTISREAASYQLPQIDVNYGVGDRVQLTFSIPYVMQINPGQSRNTGWSNLYAGVKWRFVDHGDDGWQVSTFPQIEGGTSLWAQERGIGGPGPRLLLPIEASRKLGWFDVDVEAGYFVPKQGPREQILGLVIGRHVSESLECDVELYNDRAMGALPNQTVLDLGGRYQISRNLIALWMTGRSISGTANGQPQFIGYFGFQILVGE